MTLCSWEKESLKHAVRKRQKYKDLSVITVQNLYSEITCIEELAASGINGTGNLTHNISTVVPVQSAIGKSKFSFDLKEQDRHHASGKS